MLFIPDRHEALRGEAWSEHLVRQAIAQIATTACATFDPQTLWPIHPRDRIDEADTLPMASLHSGATGAIWALQRLKGDGLAEVAIDFDPTIAGLLDHNRCFNAAAEIPSPSYGLGDASVLLQWKHLRDAAAADALFVLAEANLHNPTLEPLWGSSGTADRRVAHARRPGRGGAAATLARPASARRGHPVRPDAQAAGKCEPGHRSLGYGRRTGTAGRWTTLARATALPATCFPSCMACAGSMQGWLIDSRNVLCTRSAWRPSGKAMRSTGSLISTAACRASPASV
jgi:hypothetical protein